MSRLTKKNDESIIESYGLKDIYGSNGRKCDDTEQLIDVYNKLGKLEDLEEQLGCPLEIVFKALKEGIYFYDKWNYGERMLNYMPFLENDHFLCGYRVNEYYIRMLNDYKKTWWLKEDRSE